jgi:hypothetical protein
MTKISALRLAGCTLAFAVSLTAFATASYAYTAEQQARCTGDAFRLCSSEIPNIQGITACMRRQKANLSAPCKAVFDK